MKRRQSILGFGFAVSAAVVLSGASTVASPRSERLRSAMQELYRSGPPWRPEAVRQTARRLLDEPKRLANDRAFRKALVDDLSAAYEPGLPAAAYEVLLLEMNRDGGFPFDDFERLQVAWRAVPRSSASRRAAFRQGQWHFAPDDEGTIEASVFSLPSSLVSPSDVEAFLSAVRAADRRRRILVLTDPANRAALRDFADRSGVTLLGSFGLDYSLWPRDTFSIVRDAKGRPGFLERPAGMLQGSRALDNTMGREIVKDLPDELDQDWKRPRWTASPVPFHNGQVLLTREAAWISLHSQEPRILGFLRLARVPVDSFYRADGIDRYLEAAGRAAEELAGLYGRPVRFVHPLPRAGTPEDRSTSMRTIGGGAGFDLDSYLTLLRGANGEEALVADVRRGRSLAEGLAEAELRAFIAAYGLSPGPEELRRALVEYARSARAAALQAYLDAVSAELERAGLRVRRLPILLVPTAVLLDREGLKSRPDFLITWNNVVVETGPSGRRAEGFANLFAEGDEQARAAFSQAGFRLYLFPPLVESIIRGGGYRCASNHLRR
jgi:hypothetical protein